MKSALQKFGSSVEAAGDSAGVRAVAVEPVRIQVRGRMPEINWYIVQVYSAQ